MGKKTFPKREIIGNQGSNSLTKHLKGPNFCKVTYIILLKDRRYFIFDSPKYLHNIISA